jgi:hypothetical protein
MLINIFEKNKKTTHVVFLFFSKIFSNILIIAKALTSTLNLKKIKLIS